MKRIVLVVLLGFSLPACAAKARVRPAAPAAPAFRAAVGAPAAVALVLVTDAGQICWTPSTDNTRIFNGAAVLSSYQAQLWLSANVSGAGATTGNPAITADFGKPALNTTGDQCVLIKSRIQANTEYVLFLTALGPAGPSPASPPTVPFGFPSAPQGVALAPRPTP